MFRTYSSNDLSKYQKWHTRICNEMSNAEIINNNHEMLEGSFNCATRTQKSISETKYSKQINPEVHVRDPFTVYGNIKKRASGTILRIK